ncbi:SIMPL domain-containing protein [Cohaesibacter celericrescens]|uniref:SIMPL domain-containing protein n=1 Tax=Cohaesibacter celericrescens TaxID=2067669 RepID=UPI0035685B4D
MKLRNLFAAIPLLIWTHSSIAIAADTQYRTIAVNGSGYAEKPADYASLTAGVTTKSPSAKEAFVENARKSRSIFDAVIKAGVNPKDFVTDTVKLDSESLWVSDGEKRKPDFVAKNRIRIKIRAIGKIGQIMTSLVEAGANDVSNLSFGLEKNTLGNQARENAFDNAYKKAQLFAAKAGLKLGNVIKINEGADYSVDHRVSFKVYDENDGVADMPIAEAVNDSAIVTVSQSVGVIWELKNFKSPSIAYKFDYNAFGTTTNDIVITENHSF